MKKKLERDTKRRERLRSHRVKLTNPQTIIETVKPAEDGNGVIVRVYECAGKCAKTNLEVSGAIRKAEIIDLMETSLADAPADNGRISLSLQPFQIVSLRVQFD